MRMSMAQEWLNEGFYKGVAECERKGREEELRKTAKKMRDLGISTDLIIRATGLSHKEIKNL
jgi:predicted transposase/invertase (TIGR01784 family)